MRASNSRLPALVAALGVAALGCARAEVRPRPPTEPDDRTLEQSQAPASDSARDTLRLTALQQQAAPQPCETISGPPGPAGTVAVRAVPVATGLEVPWSLAFLPGGEMLVTERPGRLRLIRSGKLVREPVATVDVKADGEGGLLGVAVHPEFAQNRFIYLYATHAADGGVVNRIERWRLSPDLRRAEFDRVIFDGLPAAQFHDGGRLRFGPDGMLYASVGDATTPEAAQDRARLNGKLLRLTPEGGVPSDNPFLDSPVYLYGLRNTEAYDWAATGEIYLADHGPSGEFDLRGHDELDAARAGDNLGWPVAVGCTPHEGVVSPLLVWAKAMPPGGAALYRGRRIPEWTGSLLVGSLGAKHLHRFVFDLAAPGHVTVHEIYLEGDPPKGLGRIRDVVNGPDGYLYVTTSNCDGRGKCPAQRDLIARIERLELR